MIGREKRVLLRHYLEQGMNKAVIARDLGVSRRTVYHWIETGQLDRELDEERGSSPELCVKVRGSSSMLRLGCLGELLGLEE